MTAADYYKQLTDNTDDFYADTVSYEEFSKRNYRIWRAIEAQGTAVKTGVDRLLLDDLNKSNLTPR